MGSLETPLLQEAGSDSRSQDMRAQSTTSFETDAPSKRFKKRELKPISEWKRIADVPGFEFMAIKIDDHFAAAKKKKKEAEKAHKELMEKTEKEFEETKKTLQAQAEAEHK